MNYAINGYQEILSATAQWIRVNLNGEEIEKI